MNPYAPIPYVAAGRLAEVRPAAIRAVIPVFDFTNIEFQTASILVEYPLTNLVKVSIGRPLSEDLEEVESFCICIRSLNSKGYVVRYVLFRPEGFELLFPDYNGETINVGAVVEIWASRDHVTVAFETPISLSVNTLDRLDSTEAFCGLIDEQVINLIPSVFEEQPTGPCNPFCDCALLGSGGVPPLPGGSSSAYPVLRGIGSPEGLVFGFQDQWYYDLLNELFYFHEGADGLNGWVLYA